MTNGNITKSFFIVLVVMLVAVSVVVQAQTNAGDVQGTLPRTHGGYPDLQGIWTSATFTPLERPLSLSGKEFFSEEEASKLHRQLTSEGVDPGSNAFALEDTEARERALYQENRGPSYVHYDNAIWLTEKNNRKGLSTRRTSLIVEPEGGRIPELMPEAQAREQQRNGTSTFLMNNVDPQLFDSYESRTVQERCLVWEHEGPPMLIPGYNDNLQIFQNSGHVAILQEMSNNQARIIPMDGRPHLRENIRQWPGDSRGHWEGDTLVVSTTNFTHKTHFKGSSEALRVVERFTMVDPDTISYEFTVEDSTTWKTPWSVQFPLMRTEGPLYEYACHEGNHDLTHILLINQNLEKMNEGTAEQ